MLHDLQLFLLSSLLAVLVSAPAFGQSVASLSVDPALLTEAWVRGQVDPSEAGLTGEAAEAPISLNKLPRNARISVAQQWRGNGRALVGVTFATGREQGDTDGLDLYVFLDSTAANTWRISTFRAWRLPSGYQQQLDRYRNKGESLLRREYEAQFEASAARGVTRQEHDAVHGGVEQRVFSVYNLRLAASTDAALRRHFEFLKPKFEELRTAINSRPKSPLPISNDDATLGADLRYLLIRQAFHAEEGPLRLEIASLAGEDVGYLYCTEPACIPTPTPNGVVALIELGDGWWLYRKL